MFDLVIPLLTEAKDHEIAKLLEDEQLKQVLDDFKKNLKTERTL